MHHGWVRVTKFNASFAQVAQSVEQGTENPRVGSSILSLGTIYFNKLSRITLFSHPPNFVRVGAV